MAIDDPTGTDDVESPPPIICGKCGYQSDVKAPRRWRAVIEVDERGNETTVVLCPKCGGRNSRNW